MLARVSREHTLTQIAQLRHAYAHLKAGRVKDQAKFADGLIAPAIEHLENLVREPRRVA